MPSGRASAVAFFDIVTASIGAAMPIRTASERHRMAFRVFVMVMMLLSDKNTAMPCK